MLEGNGHVGDGGERGAALGLMAKNTEDTRGGGEGGGREE